MKRARITIKNESDRTVYLNSRTVDTADYVVHLSGGDFVSIDLQDGCASHLQVWPVDIDREIESARTRLRDDTARLVELEKVKARSR